ncbi:hypothetical protein CDL15_Pgr009642 [Punica granatum]|uniref:DUF569 domain-containing protein n=1 Tax=Punica granatum TaxID=22663 RepID=A0A218WSZ9_PUNGR|nr:hypothetical protein CDL15_Pgr009642 [Punica granatum]
MELFQKTKVVKLRSHLDKYLVADDDRETVRQSRNASSSKARWFVETIEGKNGSILLRSCHGGYLTASDAPFLLGMTGKKVMHTMPEKPSGDWNLQWEPIRDGFQVKLRSWCGKYLRANGGTPPWRNSVTHDEPHSGVTHNWILWDVEAVSDSEFDQSSEDSLSYMSSFSSVNPDDVLVGAGDEVITWSPMAALTPRKSSSKWYLRKQQKQLPQISSNKYRTGMEFFQNARAVRLRNRHDKYLVAEEDEESVTQERNGSSKAARWTVEFVLNSDSIIRLKSCYGKYLTASNQPFLLGVTGRKVLQTLPRRLDSSVEWEPVREGTHVKLRTRYGNFLRANGGLPPWRNSVTHDVPHRTATQDWVLWDIDVIEILLQSPTDKRPVEPLSHIDSMGSDTSPSFASANSGNFSREESIDSHVGSPPKSDGRMIYYHLADENGNVEGEDMEGYSFSFKGNNLEELTHKLGEDTGMEEIIVCSRSPLNGKLFPLRLQLPPNNATMHVVVVPSSSIGEDCSKS